MPSQEDLAPSPLPAYIYKIVPISTPPADPVPAELPISPLDTKDGFVHLSTANQVPATASRFFSSDLELYLLKVDYGKAAGGGQIKWEKAPSGVGIFPHFYWTESGGKPFGSEQVAEVRKWTRKEGEDWVDALARGEAAVWLV